MLTPSGIHLLPPDLSILAWQSSLSHQTHEPKSRTYCGILSETPSYIAWCMKTRLLIRPQRREFSVANNRAVLDWIILVTLGAPGSFGSDYVLPMHWNNSSGEKETLIFKYEDAKPTNPSCNALSYSPMQLIHPAALARLLLLMYPCVAKAEQTQLRIVQKSR
jgi:hypothetical protein